MSCHGVIFMQNWSKMDKHVGESSPVGRYGHAAVCLNYGEDQPQIFIFGGYDGGKRLNDGWILDVQSERWRGVSSLLTCCTVCDTFYTLVRISFQVDQDPLGKGPPLCKGHSYVRQKLIPFY